MRTKTFTLLTVALAVLSSVALGQDVRGPSLSGAVLTVTRTAGTVLNGGSAVAIAAGTTVVLANQTDCSAPVFAACNFIYANAAGTVAVTQTPLTAAAAGNVLLAFVETNGTVITGLRTANQSGTIQTNALGSRTVAHASFATFPTQVGMAYTDTADIAGQQWFSSIFIPSTTTLTGACLKLGTVPATDKFIVALWNSAGASVATSNLAGVAFGTGVAAQLYQCQAFTAPVVVTGPARYFVGIQGNGATANEFYTYAAATVPTGYATGITAPGAFGTITAITPTTVFTAGQGPIMSVY